jgi:hypothetical protein
MVRKFVLALGATAVVGAAALTPPRPPSIGITTTGSTVPSPSTLTSTPHLTVTLSSASFGRPMASASYAWKFATKRAEPWNADRPDFA